MFELKTGTDRTNSDIMKSETDQLAGAVAWDADVSQQCIPVLVARSPRLHPLASAPPGTRVITAATLAQLKDDVRAFATDIATDRAWERPEAVAAALHRHNLTAQAVIPKHSVKVEKPGL